MEITDRESKINIVVAGDFCPTEEGVYVRFQTEEMPERILGPTVPIFRSADIAIVNLEYPLTLSNQTLQKYGSLQKGHPDTVKILKDANINIAVLANNHMLDYGEQGLVDTICTCKAAGIDTVGAGRDLKAASTVLYKEVKGRRIAFLAICENEFSVATESSAGAYGFDLIRNAQTIREAKHKADIVIVSVHGGSEFSHYPSPNIVRNYRFFVDCGASAVVAHHPHYIQGYEIYQNAPILYSLGKLLYTRMADTGLLEVPIATLDFDRETLECSVKYDFFFTDRENAELVRLTDEQEADLQKRFRQYCEAIQSKEIIHSEWELYCNKTEREAAYLTILLGISLFTFRILRRLGLLSWIKKKAEKRASRWLIFQNCITCESHREAVLTLLKKFGNQNK